MEPFHVSTMRPSQPLSSSRSISSISLYVRYLFSLSDMIDNCQKFTYSGGSVTVL